MSVSLELRALVRDRFQGCCGYCSVSELDVGNELEVDHHRPRSHDGGDELENLVYCCTPCNRFKGAYWRAEGAPDDVRLLNPNLDSVEHHLAETVSGRLVGLTARGWFHIDWLHLNRPLLVAWRQRRQRARLIAEALSEAAATAAVLQERVARLERELAALRATVARLVLPPDESES
jgi:hypothetical protein